MARATQRPSPTTMPRGNLRLWKGAAPIAAKLKAKRPRGPPGSSRASSAECLCDHCGKHLEEDPPQHPQVRVWCRLFDDYVSLDAGVAEIVLAFWRLDVATLNSCQDNFGRIWVECVLHDYTEFIERTWWAARSDRDLMSAFDWFVATAEQKLMYGEPMEKREGGRFKDFSVGVRVPCGDKFKLQEFLTMAERAQPPTCAECCAATPVSFPG